MLTDYNGYPPKMHTGTLYVNKQPVYIIDMLEESDGVKDYVTVYEAHRPRFTEQGEEVKPTKAYDRVPREIGAYRPTTVLGKIASKAFPSKKKVTLEERPPLFMAEIVEGIDTMTGKEGLGFYEREKDEVTLNEKGVNRKHGELTGVFISLDSITWEKVRVPSDDIIDEYLARKYLYIG